MEVNGMPYKDEFDERDYTVMLEYEQYGKTYAEIARMYGVSSARIKGIYNRAKRKQVMLYLQAVAAAGGKTGDDLQAGSRRLLVQLGSSRDAAAYLEKEYKDILTAFRDGEPPSPYEVPEISEVNRICYEQPIMQVTDEKNISEADRLTHIAVDNPLFISKSFYRIELNELESAVLQEKEKNINFAEIGKQLSITADMAHNVYLKARRIQLHKKISIISEKTGRGFLDIYDEIKEFSSGIDKWRKGSDYLDKTYGDMLL